MKELLEQASQFLKDHPEINEVEIEQLGIRVHLVRFTPSPIPDSYWPYPTTYPMTEVHA